LNFTRAEDWLTGSGGVKSSKLSEGATPDNYHDDYREKFFRKMTDWNLIFCRNFRGSENQSATLNFFKPSTTTKPN